MSKSLDLGSGANIRNTFGADEAYGIDIVDFGNPNIKVADLIIEPIPFKDNTFDYVTGFDFLEHIPRMLYINGKRSQPFIDLMSEVWRVLKPGGEAFFATPSYPKEEAFQDPQHVNIITDKTIWYFCKESYYVPNNGALELCRSYGFKGEFDVIQHGWRTDVEYHLIWHMKAVK